MTLAALIMKRSVVIAIIAVVLVSCLITVSFLVLNHTPPQDRTSTPNPTAGPTINASSVGICVHSLTVKDAQLVVDSGAGWIRIDCNASDPSFSAYLKNAKTQNLSVLAILDSWLFNGDCNFTLAQWQSKVTFFVSNYADYVDAWEIWNEPTSTNPGWQLQADYLSMVQTASPVIRQVDPTAKIVLLGGLQLYTGGDEDLLKGDIAFAGNLSSYNFMQYGDAIAVHAYPWSGQVSQSVWDSYSASIEKYREIFGNSSLDIWVTETGQNLSDCSLDEAAHAGYLKDAFHFFNGTVSHTFWYALHDDNSTVGDFGLIDANMQPRQAYTALKDLL